MTVHLHMQQFSRRTLIKSAAGAALGSALLGRNLGPRATLAQGAPSEFPDILTLPANGTDLSYIELGQGDPVVFVHGSLNDLRSWGAQLEPFAGAHRSVAYSRRFHWPATTVAEGSEYAAAQHADDLAALLKGLDLGPVHLIGTSYGALVALNLAARQPASVRSLVLGEPPLLPWLTDLPDGLALLGEFDAQVWTPAREAFDRGNAEEGIRRFLDGALGPGSFDALPAMVQGMMRDNAPAMRLETAAPFEAYFSAFRREDAALLDIPTLLVTGEYSPPVFLRIADELAGLLPNGERVVIPNSSHAVHAANIPAYNEAVLAFLANN